METGINNLQEAGVVFANENPVALHRVEYLNSYTDENGVQKIVFEYQGQQYENAIIPVPSFIKLD